MESFLISVSMYLSNLDLINASILLILLKTFSSAIFFPATPLTLITGAVLGKFWGTVVSIIGNTLGATLAFLISRYLLRNFVENKILKKYPKIKEYENKLFNEGFNTIIFLRLVPLFPFNALNFLLGITKVKFKDYLLGTFFGIIPGTFAFVYLGESLKMFSFYNILISILLILLLMFTGKKLLK